MSRKRSRSESKPVNFTEIKAQSEKITEESREREREGLTDQKKNKKLVRKKQQRIEPNANESTTTTPKKERNSTTTMTTTKCDFVLELSSISTLSLSHTLTHTHTHTHTLFFSELFSRVSNSYSTVSFSVKHNNEKKVGSKAFNF